MRGKDTQSSEDLKEKLNLVEIVTLTPDNWQVYRDLRIKAHSQESAAFRSTFEEVSERTEEDWRKSLSGGGQGTDSLLFAKSENEFIGFVGVRTKPEQKLRHVGEIFFLFVDSKVRGLGVGEKLLQSGLDWLKELQRIKKVKLGVYDSQKTAVELYKKFGFEEVGVERKELFDGKDYHDHILMEKILE